MLNTIKDFFNQFIDPATHQTGGASEPALQVATAAILTEMMRMDTHLADEERAAITSALQRQFGLDRAQLDTLMALAEQESRLANDYYQFTSLINKACDYEQKVHIVENLWHVALADGHLDAHEQNLMRRMADLLYIKQGDYIAAKQRARVATGMPAER